MLQYNINKMSANSAVVATTTTITSVNMEQQNKPKKKLTKLKKLKFKIKAKARTAEEIERDEKWKRSLEDAVKKLKPSFMDMDNHLPEQIPKGTLCEYLCDDLKNGFAGIWYQVKIVNIINMVEHGRHTRKYEIEYQGDWEEEFEAGAKLTEEVDALLVRPKPPSNGSNLIEYERGDQVEVMKDPNGAEGEWHAGTVLRFNGGMGWDVLLDRGNEQFHVMANNQIRAQLVWLGRKVDPGLLVKRSAGEWQFKQVPSIQLPPDERAPIKNSTWDKRDKNDEDDEDVAMDDFVDEDENDEALDDDGWGSDDNKNDAIDDGWGSDDDEEDIVDDNWGADERTKSKSSSKTQRGQQRKNQEYKKRKAGVNMFLNGALGARKKKKVKGKSSSLRRIVDNFESQF